jgi:hypothetical protein
MVVPRIRRGGFNDQAEQRDGRIHDNTRDRQRQRPVLLFPEDTKVLFAAMLPTRVRASGQPLPVNVELDHTTRSVRTKHVALHGRAAKYSDVI